MNNPILALDFGGTKLSAAVINDVPTNERPRWLEVRREFTPGGADATYELAAMLRLARELLGGRMPAAVGVSFGGPVDFSSGTVRLSHHVAGWENFPLQARLRETFGAPAAVDNDANVAALGEHRFGAGRGVADLMYVTVSTGVGGGWVLGGRPWRGHDGMAGEIGHTVVDPAGPLCLCGKRGCVERLASGPYMAADYEEERGRRGGDREGRGGDGGGGRRNGAGDPDAGGQSAGRRAGQRSQPDQPATVRPRRRRDEIGRAMVGRSVARGARDGAAGGALRRGSGDAGR